MSRMINPLVSRSRSIREGKGFSVQEIQAAGLTPTDARRIGIPVDTRRKSTHQENIELLKEYSTTAKESGIKIPKPKQVSKGQRGRAERALTSSGQKMRGLTRGKGKN